MGTQGDARPRGTGNSLDTFHYRFAVGLSSSIELQLAGENFVSAKKISKPLEVEQSLASIRSHRSDHNADQDDVPSAVKDWSPSCVDVATDGTD